LWKRIRRWSLRAAIALLVVLALAAAGALVALRSTITEPSGAIVLAGLGAPVEVVRDREGVPHIFGATTEDLSAALGLVHAQDRLWQMELARRTAQGRLSEIFGERTVSTDIVLRTLDLAGHAERSFAALPAAAKASLEAYARGVNAYLERPVGLIEARLPPEFLILRHHPEPWRPADSIAVVKLMALLLSTNLGHETTRLTYAARGLTAADIADLMPGEDNGAPSLLDVGQLYPLRPLTNARAADASLGVLDLGGASNNWVVAGSHTRTGHALLANDPHLRLAAPSTWYLAHIGLRRPGLPVANAAGATLAGTPLIVLGRTDNLAWGFTNTGTDVQDLFIERVNPDNPDEYLTPDGWRRFASEDVVIRVAGGAPRTIQRRTTRHGPVMPSFYRNLGSLLGSGHVAALAWTALADDDTTIAAGLFDPGLGTIAQYMDRMRAYQVPMQSMVVADTAGGIGMIAPGRVPIRDPANRIAGRAPVPGWDATYDWKGFVPFDQLPHVVNPPAGAIGTANARIVPPDYPYTLTLDWEDSARQRRIDELIIGRTGHDIASMVAAQLDVLDPPFAALKPALIAAARTAGTTNAAVLDELSRWDGRMSADAADPLIFTAWVRETIRGIYEDDLGPAFPNFFFLPQTAALRRLIDGKATARDWCDDGRTAARETCSEVIAAALPRALADLETRYGKDRTRWQWGEAHYADSEHRPFGAVSWLAPWFNVRVPSAGGPDTLNRGQLEFGAEPPFANRHAASYRAVYDLGNLDRSLYIHTTGQSGHFLSPFYRSFAERWAKGEYIRIPTAREEIDRAALGTWHLSPK
jgi:penicillin amidase